MCATRRKNAWTKVVVRVILPCVFSNDDILCTSEEDDAWSAAGVYQYDGDTDDEADSIMCKKQKMF
jgi:hypothetical protein